MSNVNVVYLRHGNIRVHATDCQARTRGVEQTRVTTAEQLVEDFNTYADDGAFIVHNCAKHLFPEFYLKGRKADGTINYNS